jgi:hypothetical protein
MPARGPEGKVIWWFWGALALCNVLVDSPAVLTGFHTYYGNHPFNFCGFPP